MKRGSTLFLRLVLALIALGVLLLCVFVLPFGIRTDVTGYYGPLLLSLYIPAMPFYIALYQALKLLEYIDKNQAFSNYAVTAFKRIKLCAIAISGLFVLGLPYIFYVGDSDDAPGVVLLALVIIFASLVIGTFAAVLQKLIQSAVDIKVENDLTV